MKMVKKEQEALFWAVVVAGLLLWFTRRGRTAPLLLHQAAGMRGVFFPGWASRVPTHKVPKKVLKVSKWHKNSSTL